MVAAGQVLGDQSVSLLKSRSLADVHPASESGSLARIAIDLELPPVPAWKKYPDAATGRDIEVLLVAIDSKRRIVDGLNGFVELTKEHALSSAEGRTLRLQSQLKLPPSEGYRLRIYLRDDVTDLWSLTSLDMGVPQGDKPYLSQPVVFDRDHSSAILVDTGSGDGTATFQVGDRRVSPQIDPILAPEERRLFAFTVNNAAARGQLAVRLIASDTGRSVEQAVQISAREPLGLDGTRLLGVVDTTGLEAGVYRLEVRSQVPNTSQREVETTLVAQTSLRVEP